MHVCVGQNDLQLHFDNGASFTIESSIQFRGDGKLYSDFASSATPLANLLGTVVTGCTANGTKRLVVSFGKDTLEIVDDSEHYESFKLKFGGREFIV